MTTPYDQTVTPSAATRRGPVFIVGCGRSGTTLLRLMLNSHPAIAIPGETWIFPDVHAERSRVERMDEGEWRGVIADRIETAATFPELGVTREALDSELARLSRDDWPSVVAVANLAFARAEGKPRWGDKTPGYVRYLPLLRQLYPDAVILHMIRDGRDVTLSFMEKPFGPKSVLEGAYYWRSDVERGRRDGPRLFGAAYHEVVYEELVADPERVLRGVCGVIGEPFDERMLHYASSADRYVLPQHDWHDQAKKPVTRDRAERWRKKMSTHDQAIFELAAGGLLRELGYPVTRARTLDAYRQWGRDRATKLWRASVLKAKVTVYRAIHGPA